MGMFDYIYCDYALPDSAVQNEQFQTKYFSCSLEIYRILSDGTIKIEKSHTLGDDIIIKPSGTINFYHCVGRRDHGTWKWYEYEAIFEDGKLLRIDKIIPK